MEHIYAVSSGTELQRYQDFTANIQPALSNYIAYLQSEFQVADFPRAVLWTSEKIATQILSDIPIPAYTNDYRIVMCPDVETWKYIYIKQLDGISNTDAQQIRNYYEHSLNQHHILQILGHELAHHSDFFIDEVYDSGEGIWFEEGMAEYISRSYFLTEEEFQRELDINRKLVSLYESRNATNSLLAFGQCTYKHNYSTIFYEYWRSFLAVNRIVKKHNGDIRSVFDSYHRWFETCRTHTLAQWFEIEG